MHERMLDKKAAPTRKELTAHCGAAGELFTALNDHLEQLGTAQIIRFPYGNKYGWGICHRINKKLICDIFAERESCCMMLRLTRKQFDYAYPSMNETTRKTIDDCYPCGEGGWIHLRITNESDLKDARVLTEIKCGEAAKKNKQ